jgi:hypothetical protein
MSRVKEKLPRAVEKQPKEKNAPWIDKKRMKDTPHYRRYSTTSEKGNQQANR